MPHQPQQQQWQMPQHWSASPAESVAKRADFSQKLGGAFSVGNTQQHNMTPVNSEHSSAPQLWLQPDGTLITQLQATGSSDNAGHIGEQGVQLMNVALIEGLVKTGKCTKALREWMGADAMLYGQMRIALAHCNVRFRHVYASASGR